MIHASELRKNYGDTIAVNGLSLDIPAGQFFGLLGPNGSGKTTTLHMLATLLAPDAGTVQIAGLDVARHPLQVRSKIGLVFQETALDGLLSVEENLQFAGGLHGLSRRDCLARIDELLTLFDLQERRQDRIVSLSGGMRRVVDLARGMLHSPLVLFLDEPTVGLDLPSRKKIWRFIQNLRAQHGTTVVLTTHYLEEAAPCDQVCFIRRGQAIEAGQPDQLISKLGERILEIETEQPAACVAMLGLEPGQALLDGNTVLIRSAGRSEVTLEALQQRLSGNADTLRIRKPNLNDVFLWHTDDGQGDRQ